jgi:hypothetical protein
MDTNKPYKGTVRFKPACRPVVGQYLVGQHDETGEIRTSRIVTLHETQNGVEVETRHGRYLAVEEQ